jgi:hypothetical protein
MLTFHVVTFTGAALVGAGLLLALLAIAVVLAVFLEEEDK